ncbi:MAG: 2-phospho-L-lactate guanylyltransferase [Deltaproteobacteria bacterium]|nr:2-phospho-L-lactate guanylyltransferase [Deltaproteobacteria bacterium]MCB9786093.1 2-phospho-L-lactate guanylyltransferase [Deltaproteobacteria bacterium]
MVTPAPARLEGLYVLIPVRRFSEAKTRLAGALAPEARAALARALFVHVTHAIDESAAFAGVLVATDGDDVAEVARERGAQVLRDESPQALGCVIDRGLAHLASAGASGALVLMADLPLLAASDLRAAHAAMARSDVVIAPDAEERGTSALGLRLPAAFPTHFGMWDSFERHRASAERRGLAFTVLRRQGLARDVDTPEVLEALRWT